MKLMKLTATSLLALGLAGSAFAQSNPAPTNQTIDKNQADTGGGAGTGAGANSTKMKMKKVDPSVTNSTTKNFNKENCKSVSGKNSLQTQGGISNTQNTEDTCADNNN